MIKNDSDADKIASMLMAVILRIRKMIISSVQLWDIYDGNTMIENNHDYCNCNLCSQLLSVLGVSERKNSVMTFFAIVAF